MFIILSGAYVGQELESEFGRIPPSFLPLSNRRLFQHQVALAPEGVEVYMSIPESYTVSDIDNKWLEKKGVGVIKTPDGLSLGASLIAALNISGNKLDTSLHVLYGDTLFKELPVGEDVASISKAKDGYNWATLTDEHSFWLKEIEQSRGTEEKRIIDGYFKFSQPRELIRCITQCEWNFISGLNRYYSSVGLTPVLSNGWLDFGHVNTYYRSKAEHTTQRAFNELTITPYWVEKRSIKNNKIAAEANWFESLPYHLRGYIPQYLGSESRDGNVSYKLEYLHLTALNELFVFSRLRSTAWKQIITNCINFLLACKKEYVEPNGELNSLDELFSNKTKVRLTEFFDTKEYDYDTVWNYGDTKISIREVLSCSEKHLPRGNPLLGILHGDFCFSNILYDFRADKVKTIDPRGLNLNEVQTIYGDIRYDIAKLSHSILGLYDWIIAGYFQLSISSYEVNLSIAENQEYKEIQQFFIEQIEQKFDITVHNLYAMQIQLFLSMLPLHNDDTERQDALFANALRLHQILSRLDQ